MAFVNLPPNLQDMFYSLSDRIMKLETGPNQAMYTAETAQGTSNQAITIALTAQSVATQAEIDAINAGIQAVNAASQATLASSQATQAQLSANGKNTIYYGTAATPGIGTITGASANGTTITYQAYNGLQVGQTLTISGIANNTATITGATGTGSVITYTASNSFVVGQSVTVSGINPSRWDGSGTITAANSSSFSIAGSTTGAPNYISGGSATAPSLLNTTGTVSSQSFTQFSIASTRRGTYTSGGSLSVSGLTFQVGDIYFQYNTSSQVIAQSTWNGSSWQSTPITNTVITNIDAGKITTGIITSIEYNNGSGTFRVTPAGALTASSANITGDIKANTGYFGSGPNYWSIGAGGITGIGTASITGGLISGSSISIGSGSTTFQVNAAGFMQATGANITGAITATSGSFTGSITGATITGSTLTGGTVQTSAGASSVSLVGSSNSIAFRTNNINVGYVLPLNVGGVAYGVLTHYASGSGNPDPSGGTFPQTFVGSGNISISATATNSIGVSTSGISLTATSGGISLANATTYPGVATGAGSPMVVVTTGSRIAITTSSERFKEQIQYINTEGWLDKVLAMKPITYKTSVDFTTEGEPNELQYGFLAEDIYDLGGGLEKAVILDPLGDPFSLSYDRLTVFLTLAIKELKAEINQIKGAK